MDDATTITTVSIMVDRTSRSWSRGGREDVDVEIATTWFDGLISWPGIASNHYASLDAWSRIFPLKNHRVGL